MPALSDTKCQNMGNKGERTPFLQQMSKGMKNGREEYRKNEYGIVPKDEKKQKKRIKREKNKKIFYFSLYSFA